MPSLYSLFMLKFGFFSLLFEKRAKQTVSKLFTSVVLLLFVTYTPTCNSIFALYPAACSEFTIYSVGNESITLLRADYGINCKDLDSYHVAAYIATVVYVLGFPLSLLILLRKHLTKGGRATGSAELDFSHDDSFDENLHWSMGTKRDNATPQFGSIFSVRITRLFSLAAILINIMIVSVRVSSKYGVAIYTGLFVLDIFIIFIVPAEALLLIIRFLTRSLKR
ncbi:hypothetical protein BSL78_19906 [Apostichopus japonicus]|uniref:Uncharacterized protein n=1 Tax=Stichopus japonicus TaxID=307972 RepID=A0A2G8K5K1_STIJA|nr:hypothetical protein BSL78_19906 [Apostichopus japonicus]